MQDGHPRYRTVDFESFTRCASTKRPIYEPSDLMELVKHILSTQIKEDLQVRLLGLTASALEEFDKSQKTLTELLLATGREAEGREDPANAPLPGTSKAEE